MKKILVPTDFSDYANTALDYAVAIAAKAKAELIIIHACDLNESRYSSHKILSNEHHNPTTSDLQQKLTVLKKAIKEVTDIQVTTMLYEGNTIETILQAVKDFEADMIVMGTLGNTGIATAIFGSKTTAVIKKSVVPVMTIPESIAIKDFKKILIAINNPKEDLTILEPVFELAKLFKSEIHLITYTGENYDAAEFIEHTRNINAIEERLKQKYSDLKITADHLTGEYFVDTLEQFIQTNDIDMICMITHERHGMQNLMSTSMTRKMAYHTTVPLLSFHAH